MNPFLARIDRDRIYTIADIHKIGVFWWLSSYRTTHAYIRKSIKRGRLKATVVTDSPNRAKHFIDGQDLYDYVEKIINIVN